MRKSRCPIMKLLTNDIGAFAVAKIGVSLQNGQYSLGCTLFLKQRNGQYSHLVKARDISTVLLWGAILARSKKLPRFIAEKSMLMRKLQAKGKALKLSLNGSCMMVFKKFAGQLMYALGPLSIDVLRKSSRPVWNHFTSKIHALVKYSGRSSILGIPDVAI